MKPTIHTFHEFLPFQTRYRRELARDFPGLETRLEQGAMRTDAPLSELADAFDLILLDAYGVLNLAQAAIPGAPAAIQHLRQRGKRLRVVTNNASQPPEIILARLHAVGFDFHPHELISSGMTIGPFAQASLLHGCPYYLMGTPESAQAYAPAPETLMTNPSDHAWQQAEFLLMCSNRDYYGGEQQTRIEALLKQRPLPMLVANPDLAAPLGAGAVEVVAGWTASQLHQEYGNPFIGLGKPFPAIFHLTMDSAKGIPPERILMVGDTLETDILGGVAMGFSTCLVLSGFHGPDDPAETCRRRGIRPDFILPSIAAPSS